MKRAFFILTLLFSSCTKYPQNNQDKYYTDGRIKPSVALLPVIDNSNAGMPWDLQEEFHELLLNKIFSLNSLYITTQNPHLYQIDFSNSNSINSIDWANNNPGHAEYIACVEIKDHSLMPRANSKGLFNLESIKTFTLDISLQIKVIDIRGKNNKTILQETVHQSFFIPWKLTSIEYQKNGWGKTAFFLSPIGIAHTHMLSKVAQRMQDYILLNSR